jgi:predicted metal-dependent hydrolase
MDRNTARMLMESLNHDAERIALRFGLRYKSIDAERANVKSRYGVCYSDGAIKIRLRHATTGRPLKYSSLVNTLCHELAHLRHFNHGLRFRAFYQQLLEYARAENIYRPGGERDPAGTRRAPRRRPEVAEIQQPVGPTQLTLF